MQTAMDLATLMIYTLHLEKTNFFNSSDLSGTSVKKGALNKHGHQGAKQL